MRKSRNKERFHTEVVDFQTIIAPKKKQHVRVVPRTYNQEIYLRHLFDENKNIVFAVGSAGSGKTMLGVQSGIKMFKEGLFDKIIITRPAVSVDEEHGFLPGTLEQKMQPWVRPIMDVFSEYYYNREIEGMIREGIIEISPLAYMRGRNFSNAFIIADECQCCTMSQMKMLLTRISENSKMVVNGDLEQADRIGENGLKHFLELLETKRSDRIALVRFDQKDIQRHPVVADVLSIYHQ